MQLKEFSLISPSVEASELFQAIQTIIAPEAINQAQEKSHSFEKRKRKLPASLVVCLVIAMSLWSSDSMATVLQNLVNGLNRKWTKLGQYWKTPTSSSISAARPKLGCQVMSVLFHLVLLIEAPNTFNYRCSDVSLSNRRKSQSLKTTTFSERINAFNV